MPGHGLACARCASAHAIRGGPALRLGSVGLQLRRGQGRLLLQRVLVHHRVHLHAEALRMANYIIWQLRAHTRAWTDGTSAVSCPNVIGSSIGVQLQPVLQGTTMQAVSAILGRACPDHQERQKGMLQQRHALPYPQL